jgi:hypothetical protein
MVARGSQNPRLVGSSVAKRWESRAELRCAAFGSLGTLQEGVPDLYFFLEANRHSDAQKALDAKKSRIISTIEQLNARPTGITWDYQWGGWEAIGARKSMAAIAEASFQDEITAFFRAAAEELRECGLLDEFLKLAGADAT